MSIHADQHYLNQALAQDLTTLLRAPPAIFVDQLDIEYDRVLIPRYMLEATIETLQLADKKITGLETITRALAETLREILKLERPVMLAHPNVANAIEILGKVEDMTR